MLSEEEYRRLREDHEVAYFRADLALSDPVFITYLKLHKSRTEVSAVTEKLFR